MLWGIWLVKIIYCTGKLMKELNFVSEQLGMLGEHLKSVLITHL